MKIKPDPKHGGVVVELRKKDSELLAKEGGSGQPKPAFQLKQILVPIDFSECSKKALAYAIPLAKQFKASITLVHVVQVAYGGGEFGLVDVPLLEAQIRKSSEQQLTDLVRSDIPKEIPSDAIVRSGRPGSEIVDLAKSEGIDLIVVATHGHTGIKHVLLGSIAENVVRHAPCPVLVVRENEREFVEKKPKA